MPYFDDEFLELAGREPLEAVMRIESVVDRIIQSDAGWSANETSAILECWALICEMNHAGLIEFVEPSVRVGDPIELIGPIIAKCIGEVAESSRSLDRKAKYDRERARFARQLGTVQVYEFTEGDLDRVQRLIAETRSAIRDCPAFDEKHRRRLLARLEKLQTELHKKMADIDVFWGLMGDAGVALGKFGQDVKPVVDRIREIFSIGWQAQSRTEELPSDEPPPLVEYKPKRGPDDQ